MKMRALSIAALVLGLAAPAYPDFNVSTFEDVGLSTPNSYFNAAPNLTDPSFAQTTNLKGQFLSGGNSFSNNYNYTVNQTYGNYNSWSGWSISNQTNTSYTNQSQTPDYGFEYTSVTGSGAPNKDGTTSATYAVANTEGDGKNPVSIVNLAPGSSPVSTQITNTAYDYYSILHGDSFATPYAAGNYLLLTVDGYSGANGTGTDLGQVQMYLANFLGSDPTKYYIVTTWQTLDLSSLQGAQSLVFGLQSNKTNAYGVATPFEFAMDNFTSVTPGVVPEPSSLLLCLGGIGIGSLIFRRVRTRNGPL